MRQHYHLQIVWCTVSPGFEIDLGAIIDERSIT
jgi:hypothetical protein